MADNTKIEWADATLNYVNGCSVVSPGCTNCYAMKLAGTRLKHQPSRAGLTRDTKAGPVWTGEVRVHERALMQALAWKRGRKIFWNAHGDPFHENVSDETIDRLFAVCALTPQHTHMILTKRSARMREYLTRLAAMWHDAGDPSDDRIGTLLVELSGSSCAIGMWEEQFLLPNVWLGVSVEDQQRADERIPDLLATPAAVRFISAEPLLGPVDFTRICKVPQVPGSHRAGIHINALAGKYVESGVSYIGEWDVDQPYPAGAPVISLDWVIVGGESGPGARPMHADWARSLRNQCQAAGVAFHFKQWGQWEPCEAVQNATGGVDFVPPCTATNLLRWRRWEGDESRLASKDESVGEFCEPGTFAVPSGKKAAGRLLDGRTHDEFPA